MPGETMAAQKDIQLPQPMWDTEQVTLKDFLMTQQVPSVAKVVKGQFMNIGVSKFSPLKKLHQEVLVHSIKTGLKILGHTMARIESRDGRTTRLVPQEQRLSIPLTYKGWFELVSENGRSAKPIDSVRELAKAFPHVNNVLVRQNIKAYLINNSDGKLTFDNTRTVMAGEQLKVIGDFTLQTPSNMEGKVRLLKCVDIKGDNAYLSFDQKGTFTPIARQGDVTGVFLIKDIVHQFRIPLTVKLVQGVWPKVDSSRFSGIIRLDWAYTEETAFVCPLDRNTPRIYPIPTDVALRLVTATNTNQLKDNEAFSNIMLKCNRLVANYHNTIHLIIAVPEGAMKSKNHAMANIYSDTNTKVSPPTTASTMKRSRSKEDILMDELDDLYGYLREGKQPPVGKYTRTRDSDEETYYEEPEFEPMTKFKSRLEMLNRGDVIGSQKNTGYNFVDPRSKLDANHNRVSGVTTVKVTQLGPNSRVTEPKPLTPPDLPPRLYKRADSSPQILNLIPAREGSGTGSGSSPLSHGKSGSGQKTKPSLQRRVSKDSLSNSKSSGSDGKKDTDSKENKSSKSGSSKNKTTRKSSMPLLYL